jgi:hypothetical protein
LVNSLMDLSSLAVATWVRNRNAIMNELVRII